MTLFYLILLTAIFLNGLLAGVFFTWTNAITPGIGRLEDIDYLRAFQFMNKTILNPLFYIVFFGPIVFSPIALIIQFNEAININFWFLLASSILYGIGVVGITFLGNIPLNERLDALDLDRITVLNAEEFRKAYEQNWNNLHLIRTLTSSLSLILLLISLLLSNIS